MRGRFWREGPLAEINNREELEAWLQKHPRDVAVAFAARAALRVLPIAWEAPIVFKGDFFANVVLPVFRTTAVAWVTARYSGQQMPLLRANAAGAAAVAAASGFRAAAAIVLTAATSAATAASSATLANAAAAAGRGADAAARAAYAAYGKGFSLGFNLDLSTAFGAEPVTATLWSAVSVDATRVEKGAAASVIAGSPLWPQGQPDEVRSLWQEMKAALLAAKQDWDVWTDWYEARLERRGNDEEREQRELAYVRIEEALWNQGPAIVNAEIKHRIEELEPPQGHTQESKRSPVGLSLLDGFSTPGQSHTPDPEPSPVPEIPPPRPAALEPVWSNGKLVLPSDPARHRR
jgi:hypothetical protein